MEDPLGNRTNMEGVNLKVNLHSIKLKQILRYILKRYNFWFLGSKFRRQSNGWR